ncbi:MAG TPA: hypothetical protein VGC55_18090, partial [Dokdonella sp.]
VKLMFGDWIYWNDQTNSVTRLVSPQGFVAGRLANLSPEQSSLNKQLFSVVGSQKSGVPGSGQSATYSSAELHTLFQAGIVRRCDLQRIQPQGRARNSGTVRTRLLIAPAM